MELIKGRKVRRTSAEAEQVYRVPPDDEIWEVACSDEGDRTEQREVPASRKRRDFPIAS